MARARDAGDLVALADCRYLTAVLALQTGRPADAREPLRETLQIAAHAGKRLRVIDALDECGYLCALTGQYAEAVTLWSARDVHSRASGLADTPFELRRREPPAADARRSLGARQFRAAQDRGAALTLTAAVELAVMMTGGTVAGQDRRPARGSSARGKGNWSRWSPAGIPTPRSPSNCSSPCARCAATWTASGTRAGAAAART